MAEQQAAANETASPARVRLTAEQRAAQSRQQGLRLSRSRILEQMRTATNPRYQESLEQALANLDEQIRRSE